MRTRWNNPAACIRSYLQLSTAHSLRRSGWATRDPAKIFWLVLFCVMSITYLVLLITLFLEYTTYPVKLVETTESLDTLPFPAVTVCNMNPILASKMGTGEKSNVDAKIQDSHNLRTKVPVGEQIEIYAKEMIRTKGRDGGHQIIDTIIYCAFNGKVCHPEVEFAISTHEKYGNCMTFNNKGSHTATETGPYNGLRLMLNVNRGEDYGGLSGTEGFRVAVHAPGSKPYPDKNGFALATGLEAEAAMEFSEMKRLEEPYSACDMNKLTSLECTADGCLPPCNELNYKVDFALTSWPSINHNNSIQSLLSSFHGVEFDETQLSSVKIFYRHTTKKTIAEEPHISFTSLLSQAGGLSGLCIGFSLLTILEFFEMCMSLCCGGVGNDDGMGSGAGLGDALDESQAASENPTITNEEDQFFAEEG